MKPNPESESPPISFSAAHRLANLSAPAARKILRRLGIQPIAIVGRAHVYPASIVRQLLAASAIKTKTEIQ